MNVIRCKNGHFFDGDAYDVCPHCGENTGEIKIFGEEGAKVRKMKYNLILKFYSKLQTKLILIQMFQQNIWI